MFFFIATRVTISGLQENSTEVYSLNDDDSHLGKGGLLDFNIQIKGFQIKGHLKSLKSKRKRKLDSKYLQRLNCDLILAARILYKLPTSEEYTGAHNALQDNTIQKYF